MALVELNPVSWYETAKNAGLERDVANVVLSAAFSAQINFLWAIPLQCAKDAATGIYLSIRELEKKNLLTLTVNKKLLDANNLARFQTEAICK